jgi:hypothetical protein
MTALVLFRAGRPLVVTLSALTLANLLELLLLGFGALVLAVLSERHPRPVGRLAAAGAVG